MTTINTESTFFGTVVVIGAGATLALTIVNAVYYSKASSNCASISSSTASTLMWINIILAIIAGIILLWGLWRLIVSREKRRQISQTFTKTISQPQQKYIYDIPSAPPEETVYATKVPSATAAARTR
jgi:high-affinity Fe2+/Pb2+ permease